MKDDSRPGPWLPLQFLPSCNAYAPTEQMTLHFLEVWCFRSWDPPKWPQAFPGSGLGTFAPRGLCLCASCDTLPPISSSARSSSSTTGPAKPAPPHLPWDHSGSPASMFQLNLRKYLQCWLRYSAAGKSKADMNRCQKDQI